jgi:hypothetical protein
VTDKPANVVEIYHDERREYVERCPMAERMQRCAGVMAQNFATDLAGYVVFGVGKNGSTSLGWGVLPDAEDHPIGSRALASLAKETIDEEMIIETRIKEVLQRNGIVRPDPPKDA